jgi:hypothetical protein
MARGLVTLLALATGFVVMTASTCPPEFEQFCEDFPEFCPEVVEEPDDSQPQLAVGDEPSEVTQPELATPEPERDQS